MRLLTLVELQRKTDQSSCFVLDEIYNFSFSKNSLSQSFIDYWDIKKEKLKVNLIEETNA